MFLEMCGQVMTEVVCFLLMIQQGIMGWELILEEEENKMIKVQICSLDTSQKSHLLGISLHSGVDQTAGNKHHRLMG